jgi:ABC-2 type transport system permease protein
MWLREIKKYSRSRSRIIGSLGQPIIYLLAFGFGFGSLYQAAGGGNYINFLAPGVIGMTIIFSSVFNGVQLVMDRQFGFLKETLVAPVPRTAIMFGRILGGATTATFQGCIVLVATLFIGFQPYSWLLVPFAILVMFMIGVVFSAMGMMIGALLSDLQSFQLIMNFLVMPLFFLSGSLFPLINAPTFLQIIARFDPLTYGVDLLRYFLINSIHFGVMINFTTLLVFMVLFVGLSGYFFSKIQV